LENYYGDQEESCQEESNEEEGCCKEEVSLLKLPEMPVSNLVS
jgi:hypothetical protein